MTKMKPIPDTVKKVSLRVPTIVKSVEIQRTVPTCRYCKCVEWECITENTIVRNLLTNEVVNTFTTDKGYRCNKCKRKATVEDNKKIRSILN